MPNPTIKLKDFVQSYTFKVAYDLQRPLFGLSELPAASCRLPEINIKRNSMYFASQRLNLCDPKTVEKAN